MTFELVHVVGSVVFIPDFDINGFFANNCAPGADTHVLGVFICNVCAPIRAIFAIPRAFFATSRVCGERTFVPVSYIFAVFEEQTLSVAVIYGAVLPASGRSTNRA